MVKSPNVVNKHQNTFIREMLFHPSYFNSRYFNNILSSNMRSPLQKRVASNTFDSRSPQGYNRNSFTYNLVYKFCTCRRHPSSFIYHLYDVDEYVILYECEPFYGQHYNFCNFLTVSGLPFPLFAPRLSPRSFSQKVYKGRSGGFYCLPARSLRHLHC
jgi:hypothetical protein